METNKKLKVILEKSSTGYSAYAEGVSGIYTTGETIQEVKENIQEVLKYRIEYLQEQKKFQEAKNLEKSECEFFLDITQFFDEYKLINKSAFAEFIGEKPNYLRKISSGIVKLSDDKSKRIEDGLHRLGKELLDIHFA